ncbi:hypothetical protein NDU88_001421 [Pleurodeles waltl]|uniref:Uncharacterized protein n=1 Tax=Pleurodeles waltl TaxID=8319 RepID=A0AAV7SZE3_PLEWA|nr:hypothetical protein NDU88_001421 [Pleurodeles waltl]
MGRASATSQGLVLEDQAVMHCISPDVVALGVPPWTRTPPDYRGAVARRRFSASLCASGVGRTRPDSAGGGPACGDPWRLCALSGVPGKGPRVPTGAGREVSAAWWGPSAASLGRSPPRQICAAPVSGCAACQRVVAWLRGLGGWACPALGAVQLVAALRRLGGGWRGSSGSALLSGCGGPRNLLLGLRPVWRETGPRG